MKQVTRIEMANDKELYEVSTNGLYTIQPDEGGYAVMLDGIEVDWERTEEQAHEAMRKHAIDDDMIIHGYGIHSGRKFWQLPTALQTEVINIAES